MNQRTFATTLILFSLSACQETSDTSEPSSAPQSPMTEASVSVPSSKAIEAPSAEVPAEAPEMEGNDSSSDASSAGTIMKSHAAPKETAGLEATQAMTATLGHILDAIEALEGVKDPKCHATASRLENFIYGTPLAADARVYKNTQQRRLAAQLWTQDVASFGNLKPACSPETLDLEHYSSIAFSLRAILGAWVDASVGLSPSLKELTPDAIRSLAKQIDEHTLCALKAADIDARKAGKHVITGERLAQKWPAVATFSGNTSPPNPNLTLEYLKRLGRRKIAAYQRYNEVNRKVFLRNVQVFFAKKPLPKNEEAAAKVQSALRETMIAFAGDLYRYSQELAQKRKHRVVREIDVRAIIPLFTPHIVDEFEDVIFFHHLPADEQVRLQAYDLDSYRDSGLHWQYLGYAIADVKPRLALDPLAAELLTEYVAQTGVLLLRLAGQRAAGAPLSIEDIKRATELVSQKQQAHAKRASSATEPVIASSTVKDTKTSAGFRDVTAARGISFHHRSSDWLSRLLRATLDGAPGVRNATIPPAFGGAGVAIGDIDNDDWEDILLLSGSGNRIFRNVRGTRFEDITAHSGIGYLRPTDRRPGEPRQPILADFDNDGDQDILITYVDDPHRLYRNRGDGTFDDVTSTAHLGGQSAVGGPATVADFDGDGLLDIYIAYFGDYVRGTLPTLARTNTNGMKNRLFKNMGSLQFRDVSQGSGTDDSGWGQSVTHTDLNADGKQDLIVGNDFGVNRYYINQGNMRFRDISKVIGTDKPSYTMGFGLADLNRDARPDIYVSNIVVMVKDEKYVQPNANTAMKLDPTKMARARVVEANDLFISNAEGKWSLSTLVGRGYDSTGWSWGGDFFDADNDGDDDLYVLNGMNEFRVYATDNPYYATPDGQSSDGQFPDAAAQPNVFFKNVDGRLENASDGSGLDRHSNGRAFVAFDYDHDGDMDVLTQDYHGAATLLENQAQDSKRTWLNVTVEGDPTKGSPRDGTGSTVIATLPTGQTIWRQVSGSRGYQADTGRELHFGTGSATEVRLDITFPSGRTVSMTAVGTQQRIRVREQDSK